MTERSAYWVEPSFKRSQRVAPCSTISCNNGCLKAQQQRSGYAFTLHPPDVLHHREQSITTTLNTLTPAGHRRTASQKWNMVLAALGWSHMTLSLKLDWTEVPPPTHTHRTMAVKRNCLKSAHIYSLKGCRGFWLLCSVLLLNAGK